MRTALCLLVTLAGCTCERPLQDTPTALRFSPPVLELGEVYVGAHARFEVTLTVDGRAPCEVQLSGLEAPLSLSPSGLALLPATPEGIELVAAPTSEGPLGGMMTATGCGLTAQLPVSGTAVRALTCPAPESCTSFAFDPDRGACLRVPRAEGSSCATPCLVNARCVAGVCRGEPLSCDDLDPCTIDACGTEGTCLHLDGALSCPAPPSCAASTCDGGTCPPRPFSVVWTGPLTPPDVMVRTALMVADDDTLFWVERGPSDCTLLSVEGASGRARFSTTFNCANHSVEAMLGGEAVVIFGGLGRTVHAFETSDGRPRWVVNLRTALQVPAGAGLWVSRGVIDGEELVLSVVSGGQQRLLALSLRDGSIVWQRAVTTDAWSVEGDGQGHFLVDERTTGVHGFIVSTRTTTPWRSMVGFQLTAAGRAFTADGIFELSSGRRIAPMPAETRAVRFANERVGLRAWGPSWTLGLFDTRTGQVMVDLGRRNPEAFEEALLADDSVLLGTWPDSTLLRVQRDGSVGFHCATGGRFQFGAVTSGRILGWREDVLTAFAAPGVEPGSGWWVHHGNAGAQGRPSVLP